MDRSVITGGTSPEDGASKNCGTWDFAGRGLQLHNAFENNENAFKKVTRFHWKADPYKHIGGRKQEIQKGKTTLT